MKLKPLNDRLIVQRVENDKRTTGGIYIPDTAKEKPTQGRGPLGWASSKQENRHQANNLLFAPSTWFTIATFGTKKGTIVCRTSQQQKLVSNTHQPMKHTTR